MTCSRLTGLLVIGCVAMFVATAGASAAATSAGVPIVSGGAQVDGPEQNSTGVPHEHPDSVVRSGNPAALEERLSERLTDQLAQSAVRIRDGEYEAAQRPVADGYDADLARYMEVYRRAVTGDRQRVEQREELFAETAELQVRYAQTLSEYERVHAEYEEAQEADDRDRAQQRARELNDLTRELRETGESLAVRYQAVSDTTPGSLDAAAVTVAETTDETTQRTEAIVQEAYTPTELTAEADANGSFTSPIRLTGDLTAPGEAPPSGSVSFLVNDRVHSGSVASDGSFTLQYRPVTEPVGSASIDIAYVPDDSSLYLPSATEVTTTIAQDSPTVSIDDATDTARATSPVTTSGRVTGDGVPVANTSVELHVGDRRLAESRTDDDGEYRFDTELPAEVATGTQTLSVRAGADDAAVGPASEETELTVEETQTELTLSAARSEGSVGIAGQLVTRDGTGIGGQRVSVSLDGENRQTVETDAEGNFEAIVELPPSVDEADTVSAQAEFNGTGTNLGDAAVGAVLAPPGQSPIPDGALTLNGAFGLAVVLLFTVVYGLYRRRQAEDQEGDSQGGSTPPDSIAPEDASPFVAPGVESADRTPRLDPVHRHLKDGNIRTAVLALYGAARHELEPDGSSSGTHWEFFESTADRLSDEQRSALRDLTEMFEAVRFVGEEPDPEDVTALLTEAERLFTEPDGGSEDATHGGSDD